MEEVSSEINDQASGNHGNNIENEDIEFMKREHALLNVVVLDSISRYLKYEDIREFRLVWQRWNEVFKTATWKLSRIKIKHKPQSKPIFLIAKQEFEEEDKKLIQDFNCTFPSPGLPTNNIVFEGVIDYSLLDYFWKERGSVQLTNVYFRKVFDQSNNCIDLSPYVTTNLTILRIQHAHAVSNIKISLKMLPNIQNLCVEYCQIVLNGKIAPKELIILERNSVIYKGVQIDFLNIKKNNPQKILINEFVDFSKIKKLCLGGNIWKLDVSLGAPHLENLDIYQVELVGLIDSQWTIKRLNFSNFEDNIYIGDRMELKLFSVVDLNTVDLRSLPTTVEKMSISYYKRLIVPQFFVYPKLKYLSLCIKDDFDFPVLNFTNCTSLVDFQLEFRYGCGNIDFKRIIFPHCIKRVKLCNFGKTPWSFSNIAQSGDGDGPYWQLDTLIFSQCSLSFAEKFLKNVSSVKLAIELSTVTPEKEISILNLLKNSNVQLIAFGSNNSNISRNSDELLKIVDKAGSHFLLSKANNGKGKAIQSLHFRYMCTLSPHENELKTKIPFG